MKFFPHTNYFDCLSPMLEDHEEEILYKHPLHDFHCNQLGAIYFPEELKAQTRQSGQFKIMDLKTQFYISLGYRERIVRECYDGFTYKNYSFYPKDGNPLNLTPENVIAIAKGNRDNVYYRKQRRAFIIETIRHMNSREPYILKRGIDPMQYWEMLQLPKWLMQEYRIYKGKPLPTNPVEKKRYIKGDEQMVLLRQIYDMKQAGNSWNDMMAELNIKSRAGFAYLVKKANMTFDI